MILPRPSARERGLGVRATAKRPGPTAWGSVSAGRVCEDGVRNQGQRRFGSGPRAPQRPAAACNLSHQEHGTGPAPLPGDGVESTFIGRALAQAAEKAGGTLVALAREEE
jgi:hypothetical protein